MTVCMYRDIHTTTLYYLEGRFPPKRLQISTALHGASTLQQKIQTNFNLFPFHILKTFTTGIHVSQSIQ